MGYRITDREIDRMIRQEALDKPMADEIVRKGGVPQTSGPSQTVLAPRTIIDGFFSPSQERALGRQYLADMAGVERVRLSSQSNVTVYVLFSESVDGGALDPGDWTLLRDVSSNPISSSRTFSDPGDSLRWRTLPPEERTRLRLIISTSPTGPELNQSTLSGPFSVALQVDV